MMEDYLWDIEHIKERLDDLEKNSHPPIAMNECPGCYALVVPESFQKHQVNCLPYNRQPQDEPNIVR